MSDSTREVASRPSGTQFISSKRVHLRALADRDRHFLYELMISPDSGGRVRFGGGTPSPEKVAASLWESVLAQFVMETATTGEAFGLVAITSPNFRDGFTYISAMGKADALGSGLVAEGVLLAFHYAFLNWPFRKIYMESTEHSYGYFRSGLGHFFAEEGRLRDHTFANGAYSDLIILAIYRDTWVKLAPAFAERWELHVPGHARKG